MACLRMNGVLPRGVKLVGNPISFFVPRPDMAGSKKIYLIIHL